MKNGYNRFPAVFLALAVCIALIPASAGIAESGAAEYEYFLTPAAEETEEYPAPLGGGDTAELQDFTAEMDELGEELALCEADLALCEAELAEAEKEAEEACAALAEMTEEPCIAEEMPKETAEETAEEAAGDSGQEETAALSEEEAEAAPDAVPEETVPDVHVHSLIYVPEVEPTEETEGMLAHYVCEGCGKLFLPKRECEGAAAERETETEGSGAVE